jgi:ribosomal protein S18 acetylase RimI-like enzyme
MPEPKCEFFPSDENRELEKVKFREIRIEDSDDMVEIINEAVRGRAYIKRREEITKEENLSRMEKDFGNDRFIFLAAEINGKVVGWGVLAGPEKESSDTGVLGSFLLSKSARGTGVSDELLERIIQEAKNKYKIKRIILNTSVPNTSAINLYERHGFVKTETKIPPRDHYGEVEERIEMAKMLE